MRVGRGLAVVVTYGLLLLFLGFGSLVVSQVVTETGRFCAAHPQRLDDVGAWFASIRRGSWAW